MATPASMNIAGSPHVGAEDDEWPWFLSDPTVRRSGPALRPSGGDTHFYQGTGGRRHFWTIAQVERGTAEREPPPGRWTDRPDGPESVQAVACMPAAASIFWSSASRSAGESAHHGHHLRVGVEVPPLEQLGESGAAGVDQVLHGGLARRRQAQVPGVTVGGPVHRCHEPGILEAREAGPEDVRRHVQPGATVSTVQVGSSATR